MSGFDFKKADPKHNPKDTFTDMAAMIDLETLGTTSGSPIVTIGAVVFNPYVCDSSEELVRRGLNIRIDLSDAIDKSRGVEGKTIRWWFEQDDEAIKALVGDDAISMREAITKLFRYCNDRGLFVNDEFSLAYQICLCALPSGPRTLISTWFYYGTTTNLSGRNSPGTTTPVDQFVQSRRLPGLIPVASQSL